MDKQTEIASFPGDRLRRQKEIEERLSRPVQCPENPTDEEAAAVRAEFDYRIALLFERHGLQSGNWETLARTLAFLHEPGLGVARSGRKQKWDVYTSGRFFFDVDDAMRAHPDWTQNHALKTVAGSEKWASFFRKGPGLADAARKVCDVYRRHVEKGEANFQEAVHRGAKMLGIEVSGTDLKTLPCSGGLR